MTSRRKWNLGVKLCLVAAPFLLLAFAVILLTLWISVQLDGGAAAVNEAGRMRMQVYRMSLTAAAGDEQELAMQNSAFDRGLVLLRDGDPQRPLLVPWDGAIRDAFTRVRERWRQFRTVAKVAQHGTGADLPILAATFVTDIDGMVAGIEHHLSRWTALLHLLQLSMLVLAVLGAATVLYTGYLFVLAPLRLTKQAIEQIQRGDLGARVSTAGNDEFATLANGFNGMAEHLQSMYRDLEAQVSLKTAQLEEKRARLEALYDLTALVARATTLDTLAREFVEHVTRVAHADAVALRWSDESNTNYFMLASSGLPETILDHEQCLRANQCHCGAPQQPNGARVIPIRSDQPAMLPHCASASYQTLVCVPVRHHQQIKGEIDLFFNEQYSLTPSERSLLEAFATHLAAAIENLRIGALEREAAVAQERGFIARELHDSIAQSLAFLKIQVQLLRRAYKSGDAAQIEHVLTQIDEGVRESYSDVRELLMHFRTRTNIEDIEPALRTTLRKFEHQSGIKAELNMHGRGICLAPDKQLQVLHVVQEALSNVRKHANATRVWLEVQQQPNWRFEVRDNGSGFDHTDGTVDETHVGLRIMTERAERIGATVQLTSTPGNGTAVILELAGVGAHVN